MFRTIVIALAFSLCAGLAPRQGDAAPPPRTGPQRSTIRLLSVETPAAETQTPSAAPVLIQPGTNPQLFPTEASSDESVDSLQPYSEEATPPNPPASLEGYADQAAFDYDPPYPPPSDSFFAKLHWLGFRHSSTNGRNAGMGVPLVGTSWINRPYYLGIDLGTVWVTNPPQDNITSDIDTYGGIYAGMECDYYWATEFAVQRATPELKNESDRDVPTSDRMMIWSANMLYYPWGDSMVRPYWRVGIGAMEIDYPGDSGRRVDETLWAFPIGLGIKYPVKRWLAARAEITDNIGLGNTGVDTQHDMTLTFALEWRIGARPRSYWPWNPSNHIW